MQGFEYVEKKGCVTMGGMLLDASDTKHKIQTFKLELVAISLIITFILGYNPVIGAKIKLSYFVLNFDYFRFLHDQYSQDANGLKFSTI